MDVDPVRRPGRSLGLRAEPPVRQQGLPRQSRRALPESGGVNEPPLLRSFHRGEL